MTSYSEMSITEEEKKEFWETEEMCQKFLRWIAEENSEESISTISPEIQEVLYAIKDTPISYLSLIDDFNWNEIKEMMEVLFICNCCARHNKNKPHISDLENGHIGRYDKIEVDCHYTCECPCRHEARLFCRIINDKDHWEDSEFMEPGYDNKYHRDIELGCMCEDCISEEHKEDENRCIDCDIDMGPNNPRQLCGKTYCMNLTEHDDDGSIS
jgi:hypothetical protein